MTENTAALPSAEIWNDPVADIPTDIQDVPVAEMTPAEKKLYKLNVDGAEEEVDEEQLIKHAQKYKAADKKFQESAQLRKQAEQLLVALKQDPFSVLKQLDIDPTELARDHLTKELQRMRMSPEEQELAELRQYKQTLQEQQEQALREQQEAEETQLRDQLSNQMTQNIIQALEEVGLPRDESSVHMMAEVMKHNIKNDLNLTWSDAADIVKYQHEQNYRQLFSQLDEESLANWLGEDMVNKLVKRSTKRLVSQPAPKVQPTSNGRNTLRKTVWDE